MTRKDLKQPRNEAVPIEGQNSDCMSLRTVTGKTAEFAELVQDCVYFANGSGGQLLIGIEDGETAPPVRQRIDPALLDRVRKRIGVDRGKVEEKKLLSAVELVDAIWQEVPDFRESYGRIRPRRGGRVMRFGHHRVTAWNLRGSIRPQRNGWPNVGRIVADRATGRI